MVIKITNHIIQFLITCTRMAFLLFKGFINNINYINSVQISTVTQVK